MIFEPRRAHVDPILDDLLRALSGAFLFGTPLLFTMEMWWIGEFAESGRLIAFLVVAFGLNVYLALIAGFRRQRGTLLVAIQEAVDALAVGVVAALGILLVLNQIQIDDPWSASVAKVAVQAVPLSLGAAVASVVFSDRKSRDGGDDPLPPGGAWRATLNDIGATAAGGLFIGLSIAPTDEIPMLATEMTPAHEVALIGISLLLSYVIVFESGFGRRPRDPAGASVLRRPLTETAAAYVVSLVVAAAALYFFHRLEFSDPWPFLVSQIVILGLPVSIGGAAGRLVVA